MQKNIKKGKLFVISGPSGVGKGTICKMLLDANSDIELSVSSTTRSPREGEIDGINYNFVSIEDFEEAICQDGFLEYANVFGNYYGTPKDLVLAKLSEGVDVLLEIDVQGAMQIKNKYADAVLVFILPPSIKELRHRITTRATDAKEVIDKRISKAIDEIKFAVKYDYVIVNSDIELALSELKIVMNAEKLRVDSDIDNMILDFEKEIK